MPIAKVLIVEDELLIRMGLAADFEEGGYDTVQTSTAFDALHIIRTIPGIKVVFTDINMPGDMDGLTLAHYIRQHWPHMVIIVSSGKQLPTVAALPSGARFLAKPVSQATMAVLCNDIKEQLL
ncbi:response regulator [Hyphomicrobium sp. 2TAF46]|uniref:response regulator n=1 Tax=Hyphomicrobium sp. 2TAF46 TaxID=3233019 RepID=UPI003F8E6B28